jgi:hypothetical protein
MYKFTNIIIKRNFGFLRRINIKINKKNDCDCDLLYLLPKENRIIKNKTNDIEKIKKEGNDYDKENVKNKDISEKNI